MEIIIITLNGWDFCHKKGAPHISYLFQYPNNFSLFNFELKILVKVIA